MPLSGINFYVGHGSVTAAAWKLERLPPHRFSVGDYWLEEGRHLDWLHPLGVLSNGNIYNGFNCWPWRVHQCDGVCIYIPPWNMELGPIGVDVGEFTNGKWGFKGYASMCIGNACGSIGFYVDTTGISSWATLTATA